MTKKPLDLNPWIPKTPHCRTEVQEAVILGGLFDLLGLRMSFCLGLGFTFCVLQA